MSTTYFLILDFFGSVRIYEHLEFSLEEREVLVESSEEWYVLRGSKRGLQGVRGKLIKVWFWVGPEVYPFKGLIKLD